MIVFVAPPFHGHLDVLYAAASQVLSARPGAQVHVIICGWTNVPLPISLANFKLPYTYLHVSPLTQTEPDLFNATRSAELFPVLKTELLKHVLLGSSDALEAIVYDFFCWEAQRVAEELRIPSTCSIPAIPPALYSASDYEARGRTLTPASTCPPLELPWISDAHYRPGSVAQWIWAPPALLEQPEASAILHQLGPNARFVRLQHNIAVRQHCETRRRGVFMSLGTVVTGNLLHQFGGRESALFQVLITMYRAVIEWAQAASVPVTIAIPGAADLFRKDLCSTNASVTINDLVDSQPEYLQSSELFVTHGGGNSVREALEAACPMLIVPFFGDQWDSARHVARESLGRMVTWLPDVVCSPTANVSTSIYSSAWIDLHSVHTRLGESMGLSWQERDETRKNITQAMGCAVAESITTLLHGQPYTLSWHAGDLLFGVTVDRIGFVQAANLSHAVAIGDLRPFSERSTATSSCPSLVDEYNDVLRLDDAAVKRELTAAQSDPRLQGYAARLTGFHAYLSAVGCTRPVSLETELQREQVWDMCVHGLDYFTRHHAAHIHFVLSTFDESVNAATRKELNHIIKHAEWFRERVTFWTCNDDGTIGRFTFDQVVQSSSNTCELPAMSDEMLEARLTTICCALKAHLSTAPFFTYLQPSWNERVKTRASRAAKRELGRTIDDLLGIRLSYPYAEELYTIADHLVRLPVGSPVTFHKQHVWEGGKIIYLYGHDRVSQAPVEIQLWPSIYLAAFQSEHDAVYKAHALTDAAAAASADRRKKQHALQQHVDSYAVRLTHSK